MSGEDPDYGFSKDRAELFEALGHPTRIKILEQLANSPLSFSDLKKALNIESSGQLQFHLGKLQGLIKTADGNYSLTDEGKEALRIMAVNGPARTAPRTGFSVTPLQTVVIVLAVALALTTVFALYNDQVQTQNFSNLNQNYQSLNQSYNNLNQSYNDLAQLTDELIGNGSLIYPPVSASQALQIAFNGWGLNETSLLDYKVTVQLDYVTLINFTTYNLLTGGESQGVEIHVINQVTEPVSNYSAVIVNGSTYHYAWAVALQPANAPSNLYVIYPNYPDYYIDASTGQVLQYEGQFF